MQVWCQWVQGALSMPSPPRPRSVSCAAEENVWSSTMKIDHEVVANIDVFLRLKNAEQRKQYDQFTVSNQTLTSLFATNIFLLIFTIPTIVLIGLALRSSPSDRDKGHDSAMIVALFGLNVTAWFCYFKLLTIFRRRGRLPRMALLILQRVLVVGFLFMDAIMCYNYLAQETFAHCVLGWNCNDRAVTTEIGIVIMLIPIMYSTAVRGANFEVSMLLWIMTVGTLIASLLYHSASNSVLFVLYYCVGSIVILVEAKRQNYFLFFTHCRLEAFLSEKERAADEQNAQELRHMIANVAHDLKTPLTSFVGGIELISHITHEITSRVCTDSPTCKDLTEFVSSIMACVVNMRNTNAFMLMTINRCIDYTKASKGMQLKPKFETVDLMETLSLPLNCMKDIQQRVCIELEPLAEDICSHVITDRQWLQENVLCLLSNAVKYSINGHVRVAVILSNKTTPPSDGAQVVPVFVRVEVEDHGIGLTVEMMASLFSPFKQAQRLAGGTGLGLFSLAKRIEALEGRCGVQRRRDGLEGSLFWFEVPYRPDVEAARLLPKLMLSPAVAVLTPAPSASRSGMQWSESSSMRSVAKASSNISLASLYRDFGRASGPSPLPPSVSKTDIMKVFSTAANARAGDDGLDVLVVDDSPVILNMTTMMLKRHRHDITTATNGAEAIQVVTEKLKTTQVAFDVILMDLQMPVMDGLEATRRLRALEASSFGAFVAGEKQDDVEGSHPRPPPIRHIIIGVSANSDQETTNQAFRVGADAFISKPFTLATFYSTFEKVVALNGKSCVVQYDADDPKACMDDLDRIMDTHSPAPS